MKKMNKRLKVGLISTGGTIAGLLTPNESGSSHSAYQSAQLPPQALLDRLPELAQQADWLLSQPYSIGSQNLAVGYMLTLRYEICKMLQNPDCSFVLVTHGTDTLEEMLFWLYLTLPSNLLLLKPLLFVAAMRPADHPQSDGQANLFDAFKLGRHLVERRQRGFGLVMNQHFTPAPFVQKHHTTQLNAFDCEHSVLLNLMLDKITPLTFLYEDHKDWIQGSFSSLLSVDAPDADTFQPLQNAHVDLIYCSPCIIQPSLFSLPSDCSHWVIVVAAPGHGSIPDSYLTYLSEVLKRKGTIIRATRVQEGGVNMSSEFSGFEQFRALGILPVWKGQFFDSACLSIPQTLVLASLLASSHKV
jgi:L-asparaginase